MSLNTHIGGRLKQRRKKLGMSQSRLADTLGVSYQLVQKYESGESRISADMLYLVGEALAVPPHYFFAGYVPDDDGEVRLPGPGDVIRPGARRSWSILLVEDHPEDEALFRNALDRQERQLRLHVAHDGDAAMTYLRGRPQENPSGRLPDFVFLDLDIPRRDGFAVLKDIRQDRTISFLPVIVLTNSIDTSDLMRAYELAANGYICKSFDIDQFRDNIHSALAYWTETVVTPTTFR